MINECLAELRRLADLRALLLAALNNGRWWIKSTSVGAHSPGTDGAPTPRAGSVHPIHRNTAPLHFPPGGRRARELTQRLSDEPTTKRLRTVPPPPDGSE